MLNKEILKAFVVNSNPSLHNCWKSTSPVRSHIYAKFNLRWSHLTSAAAPAYWPQSPNRKNIYWTVTTESRYPDPTTESRPQSCGRVHLLTYEGIQSGDPYVGLVWTRGDQVQRFELLAVDYGEGTFFTVRPAKLLVPKDGSVLSGPNLLDGIDRHWNEQAELSSRVIEHRPWSDQLPGHS